MYRLTINEGFFGDFEFMVDVTSYIHYLIENVWDDLEYKKELKILIEKLDTGK